LILTCNNIWTSLLIALVVFGITSSSVIGTGYGKKVSSNIFTESETVQTLPDNSQNIIKRIAELQKQINELKRQIETLPSGPPGPPGPPGPTKTLVSQIVTTTNTADAQDNTFTASCPEGKILTGGGFEFPPLFGVLTLHYSGPGPGSSWMVKVQRISDDTFEIKVFAVCVGLE
jgi:hypothetical protein